MAGECSVETLFALIEGMGLGAAITLTLVLVFMARRAR